MKNFYYKRMLKIFLTCCITMTHFSSAFAENIGVCTHMQATHTGNDTNGILNLVNDIESDWVRDELRWGWGMETVKGVVHMPTIDWTKKASEKGVNNLVILGFGNTIYNPDDVDDENGIYVPTVDDEEYFEAFINYVKLVATECKGRVKAYEIWNEPNHKNFNYQIARNKYSYDAEDYYKLLEAAYKTIKYIDEDAMVVGGAFLDGGTVTNGWVESLFKAGAADYMDAFSFHVYTYKDSGTETAMRTAYDKVETVMDKYDFDGEVWLTETGYFTGTADYAVTEREQAALAIRSKIAWDSYLKDNNRKGKFFWYDLREDGTDESNAGHRFGLASYGYVPKDAFYAVKEYNHLLSDKNFAYLEKSDDENDYVALYEGTDENITDKVFIVYKKGNYSSAINIPVSGDKAYVYDLKGNKLSEADTEDGNLTLTFSDTSPVFVHCKDYSTEIDALEYDENKNICTVSGRAENFKTVTIELVRESQIVQTETAYVNDDGNFSKFFSVDCDGEYTIRIGKPELEKINASHYAEKSIRMYRNSIKNTEISINLNTVGEAEGLRIYLSGNAGEGEQLLNLLLVPSEKERTLSNAAYIGDVRTESDGSFDTSFKISQANGNVYDYTLYVRGKNTNLKQEGVEYVIGKSEIYAYDFTLNLKGNQFIVSAYLKNTTEKTKKPIAIVAQYGSNGKMTDIEKVEVELKESDGKQLVTVQAERKNETSECRAFIWEDADSLTPVVASITKIIN